MKYPQIQGLEYEKFRRLTGVKRSTFEKMISILKEADIKKKSQGGRNNKLCIEDTLIKHPDFSLPGPNALLKIDMEYELVLIEATEIPIERPKKDKEGSTQEKRKDIH